MITLLASIAGFVTSIIPELIRFFKDKEDKKHELEILDRQMLFSKETHNKQISEIELKANIIEQSALYKTYTTGINWVDGLNGTVRPVLAYSFFIMYMGVKYMQYSLLMSHSMIIEYIEIVWDVDDQAIFAGIISFYFGQRGFKNTRR